jgi:hypothetical protein
MQSTFKPVVLKGGERSTREATLPLARPAGCSYCNDQPAVERRIDVDRGRIIYRPVCRRRACFDKAWFRANSVSALERSR